MSAPGAFRFATMPLLLSVSSMRRRPVLSGVLLVAALLALSGVLGLRAIRARVLEAAARRGGVAEVDWVRPSLGGWVLSGVRVRFPAAPTVRVELREVRLPWSGELRVEVDGELVLEGDRATVLSELEELQGAGRPEGGSGDAGPRAFEARGLELRYAGSGEAAKASGVGIVRRDGSWELTASTLELSSGGSSIQLSAMSGELVRVGDGAWRIRRALAEGGTVEVTSREASAEEASGSATEGSAPSVDMRLQAARLAVERLRELAARRLSADARVELRGLRGAVIRGGQRLQFGPASLVVRVEDERPVIEYLAGSAVESLDARNDGLILRAALARSGEPLELVVRGGPILLSTLGVREGDLLLRDTDRASLRADARLTLSADGASARFSGEARFDGLGLSLGALAKEPLRGLSASFRGRVEASSDGRRWEVSDGELEIGQVRVLGSGKLRVGPRPDGASSATPRIELEASYSVPLVPCQTMLDAAPEGLLPTVKGIRMAGSFGLDGHARFDTAALDKSYDVGFRVSCNCRVTDVPPSIDVSRFARTFKHVVPSSDGRTTAIETGPGAPTWTPYGSISKYMEVGVIGFEDGRFHRHEGFDHEAIRNSLRENLRAGRFVRGASTISMQLAKNLYLPREKTLSRKVEEAILTLYLEQALTKQQILELYLNVVEFGPMVYGVDAGAAHYFNTSPSRLSASQAFYLASILPNPKREHFAAGGQLSDGWLRQLRTVMRHAHKRNRLSDEELAAALSEIPVRGSASPLRDPEAEGPSPPSELHVEDAAGGIEGPADEL